MLQPVPRSGFAVHQVKEVNHVMHGKILVPAFCQTITANMAVALDDHSSATHDEARRVVDELVRHIQVSIKIVFCARTLTAVTVQLILCRED